jgi:hypothetical protein
MKRSLATKSVIGIGFAKTQPMKELNSISSPDREAPGNAKTRGTERPKKIRIVFEDDVSARSVEVRFKNNFTPAMVESKFHILHPANRAGFGAIRFRQPKLTQPGVSQRATRRLHSYLYEKD